MEEGVVAVVVTTYEVEDILSRAIARVRDTLWGLGLETADHKTEALLLSKKRRIKFIPSSTFENLNSLEILNLQNNKLSILSEDLVDSTVDTLKVIDITDNPLVCDCKLYWFVAWLQNLQESNEKEDLMSKKKTICTMKSEHREYHLQNMPVYEMGCSPSEKYKKLSSSSTTYKTSTFVLISFLIAI
uniref:LRRCT domain-containing protein n=1 Tax=Trichogramma kaykai TaxID=54128 RepID=A0ABD2WZN1_9HYME